MKKILLDDLKQSMKDKDELRKDTITLLRSAILQIEKDTQKEMTLEEMHVVVAKEIKKRKDSIEDYKKGNREDIVENIEKEIKILEKYLPEQLSIEEIHSLIEEAIKSTGANSPKDMGKIMQYIKPKTAGKADGKVVSTIVKEKLNNI